MSSGYDYTQEQILELGIRAQFPERSAIESRLIWEFLQRHGLDYDNYSITVRVGQGVAPNPAHDPGVQRQTVTNSQLRIDMVAWRGAAATLFEVKLRANHHAIGQLRTYRHLWMEDHPDAPEPALAVIARTIDPDLERVFDAEGITVYLEEAPAGDGGPAGGGLSPDDADTA